MTRRGKIARLPRALRDELNQRIEDGETGARLVEWLNGREDVQGVLKIHFGGRAITEQNLSDWRAGGYADWQENQRAFELANGMMDEGAAVAEAMVRQAEPGASTGGRSLADHVGDMAALSLAKMLRTMRRLEDGPEQWETTLKIVREVVRLRRSDREYEDALRRRETREREEEIDRYRARAASETPSERLEKILAGRRGEFGDMPEDPPSPRLRRAGGGEGTSRSTSMSTSAEEGGQAEVEMDAVDPMDEMDLEEPAFAKATAGRPACSGHDSASGGAGCEDRSASRFARDAKASTFARPSADRTADKTAGGGDSGQTEHLGSESGDVTLDANGSSPPEAGKRAEADKLAQEGEPGAARETTDAHLRQGFHLRQGYGGQDGGQDGGQAPQALAAPQGSSGLIKVDRRSRRRGRGVSQLRVVNRRR